MTVKIRCLALVYVAGIVIFSSVGEEKFHAKQQFQWVLLKSKTVVSPHYFEVRIVLTQLLLFLFFHEIHQYACVNRLPGFVADI